MRKLALWCSIVLCVGLFTGCALIKYKQKIKNTEIENLNIAELPDGTYEGFYDVYLVNAKVSVRIENGKITAIKLLEHKHGKGYSGEKIIDKVLNEQSLKVDVISGATASSKTILKSIEIALKSEKKE